MIFLRIVVIALGIYVLIKIGGLEVEVSKLKKRTQALKVLLDAARDEVMKYHTGETSSQKKNLETPQHIETPIPTDAIPQTSLQDASSAKSFTKKKLDSAIENQAQPSHKPLDIHLGQPKIVHHDYQQKQISPSQSFVGSDFSWLTENRQMKLGAFIFLLGLIWGVSYAFINNWIGPVGRILLGVLVGAGFMILGAHRIRKVHDQGTVFIGLGMVCVLISLYLGRGIYGFFSSMQLLVLSLIPVGVTSFLAVCHDSKKLAIASLSVGLIAPLFAHVDHHRMGLIGYIFVLCVGVVVQIAHRRNWRELSGISLLGYILYSLIILGGFTGEVLGGAIAFLFPTVIFLLFFIVHVLDLVVQEENVQFSSLLLPVLNAGLYLRWIPQVTADEHISLVLFFVAVLFGVVVYLLSTYGDGVKTYKKPLMVYLPLAVVFLAIATGYEFSGPVLVMAYLLEVTALVVSMAWVGKRPLTSMYVGGLYILPLMLGWESFVSSSWHTGLMHEDMLVVAMFVGVSIGLVALYQHCRQNNSHENDLYDTLHTVYFVLSVAGGVIWIALMSKSLPTEWVNIVSYLGQMTLVGGLSVYGLYQKKYLWSQMLLMGMVVVGLVWIYPLTSGSGWIPFVGLLVGAIVYGLVGWMHSRETIGSSEKEHAIFDGPLVPVLTSLVVMMATMHMMIIPLAVGYQLELQSVLMMTVIGVATVVLAKQSYRESVRLPVGILSGAVIFYGLGVIASGGWMTGIGSPGFLLVALQAVFFLGLARCMTIVGTPDETQQTLAAIQYGVATLLGLWLVRNGLELVLENDQLANTLALVLYSIGGIIGYVQGANRSMPRLKRCSGFLVLAVVADLLLVQVRVMTLGWRIVTFLAVGIVLLLSAYFHKKEGIDISSE